MDHARKHLPPILLLLLILVGIVLAVLLIRWYYAPIPSSGTLEVSDDDGNAAEVRLELTLHRSFFQPTQVLGTVEFQGQTYQDMGKMTYGGGLWGGFLQKLRGLPSSAVFSNAANFNGNGNILGDLIVVQIISFDRQHQPQEIFFTHDETCWTTK